MTLAAWGAACASFGVLFAVFVPLERAFAARARQRIFRPEWGTDVCFFLGQYLLFSAVSVFLLSALLGAATDALGGVAPLSALPLALRVPLAVVLGDVLVYWFHRACHAVPSLWRFHAVHHSVEHLDWLAAHREHPVDGLLTQLCQNLPAIVLGAPFEAIAGLVVFRGAWGVFIHSNVRISLGPIGLLLGAPELHHWHHAKSPAMQHNFANLAPWLDVVFGTHHRPQGPETYALGLSEPWPRGYLSQLIWPFIPQRARRGRHLLSAERGS